MARIVYIPYIVTVVLIRKLAGGGGGGGGEWGEGAGSNFLYMA